MIMELFYKKGSENCVANALSRYTSVASLTASSMPVSRWMQDLILETSNCAYVTNIVQKIQDGSSNYPKYIVDDGQFQYKGRLVLDPNALRC